ncbi:MAG TPA: DUF881 domain-containing protein [Acidimicrobiia bacterium]|nr:DUF881 domain-containing protein [Acidimicrobiia bacterium]
MRDRLWAPAVAAVVGFLLMTAHLNPLPGRVSVRAPERERLASLIRVEQGRSSELRVTADDLRSQVAGFQRGRGAGGSGASTALTAMRERMGLVAAEGPGMVVTLDDSSERQSPSGNLNDLVIHSQDVQAVANGLWAAGAEALAVNGQRVVPTSAILCVGNTLLINGTVHSPPFRFTAIGADLHNAFMNDPLVERFAEDADRFKLGFKVEDKDRVNVPAYSGTSKVRFARAG